jgi:homoserine dehydrogenase
MQKIRIGLLGFGTVGSGTAKILLQNRDILTSRAGVELELKRIAVRNIKADRGFAVSKDILTTDPYAVIRDPQIDIVVELIGGYEPAKTYILEAIRQEKQIVTANKALLAAHGNEVFAAAQEKGVEVGFEASVCGGIPVIKAVKEGLVANRVQGLFGILNGTSNFILTKMTDEGASFADVLKEAQKMGYAEADPTFDVEGVDAAHKLTILLSLAYGLPIDCSAVYTEGISRITPLDIQFMKDFGYRIKLLAISRDDGSAIEARVHPTLIPERSLLANVNEAYNGLYLRGDAVGNVMFYGPGAGMMPTGSAVVSDIVDIARNKMRGALGRVPALGHPLHALKSRRIKAIDDVVTKYYFRFSAEDRPGVLATIAGILGNHGISIASAYQPGRGQAEGVPVVMISHEAKEAAVQSALSQINQLNVVKDKTMLIRIEDWK